MQRHKRPPALVHATHRLPTTPCPTVPTCVSRHSQYLKVAFIVKVRRGGRDFYLGVGLGDNDWKVHGERVDSANDMANDGDLDMGVDSANPTANDGDLGVGGGLSRWLFACSPDYQHPCVRGLRLQIVGHAGRHPRRFP